MTRNQTLKPLVLAIVFLVSLSSLAMLNFAAAPEPSPASNSLTSSNNSFFVHPLTVFYHAYFDESGLPSGTDCNVTYDGGVYSSTTSTIEITLSSSGSYPYSIPFAVSGTYKYPPYPSSGTLSDTSTLNVVFGANLTATPSATDVNLKVWFHSTLGSNAIPPLDYYVSLWVGSTNVTTGTTNSSSDYTAAIYHTFPSSGTYNVFFLWWAPAGGAPSSPYSFITPTVSVVINPLLSVNISASRTVSDFGQPVTFNSNVSGGTPPYSYQWFLNNVAVSGATSSIWTTTTLPVGTDQLKLEVTDAVGDPSPGRPDVSIPTIDLNTQPWSNTVYIGDMFNVSIASVGYMHLRGNYSDYTYQWYLNGTIIPNATNWWYATWEDYPGTYDFTVAITSNTTQSGVFQGTWYGQSYEIVKANVLPPNSIEFIESGLPSGSVWSAAFTVEENSSFPYGTTFDGSDGFYTQVHGDGLPTVIITPPNGTWTYWITDYVMGPIGVGMGLGWVSPGNYTPNITRGTVTLPADSSNGSVIIHVTFTPIGGPQNQTNTALIGTSINSTLNNTTISSPTTTIFPVMQNTSLPSSASNNTPLITQGYSAVAPEKVYNAKLIFTIIVVLVAIFIFQETKGPKRSRGSS